MDQVLPILLLPLPVLGATTMALALRPGWRRIIPVASPVLLAMSCMAAAFWALAVLGVGMAPVDSAADWPVILMLTVATTAAGAAAFGGEKWLSVRWGRGRAPAANSIGALPASLAFVQMPSRDESFRAVRAMAANPTQFTFLTMLTVAAEEFLYRYVILLVCVPAGLDLLAGLVLQAVLYSLNHTAFGIPALIGKLGFGLVLGAGTLLSGSVIPALVAHLCYQLLVARQFRTRSVQRA